jgi:hypothetical protein
MRKPTAAVPSGLEDLRQEQTTVRQLTVISVR